MSIKLSRDADPDILKVEYPSGTEVLPLADVL